MNKRALALVYLRELIEFVGPGFHIDTDFIDYVPEYTSEQIIECQAKLDFVIENLDDPYADGLDMYMEMFYGAY